MTTIGRRTAGLASALGWVLVPVVPVALESVYNGILVFADTVPRDPRDWDGPLWVLQVGPLLGFGFLAGATAGVPDPEPRRRGPRGWLARRSVWVTVGPWAGFLLGAGIVAAGVQIWPTGVSSVPPIVWFLALGLAAYGWLWPAAAAVRRARRGGAGWRTVRRGLGVAAGFLGSLFGSFWAITEAWRGFFFDPRVVPALLAGAGLALLCGCTSSVTYGQVRRRELFHAMLLAWTFGLAVLWRWWARRRPS